MASNSVTSSEDISSTVVQLVKSSKGGNGRERERESGSKRGNGRERERVEAKEETEERGKKEKRKDHQRVELASPRLQISK